jgi:hypothetical protein
MVVKRQCCVVEHSVPSSAEGKNGWSCTAAPSICLRVLDNDISFASYTISYLTSCISVITAVPTVVRNRQGERFDWNPA